VADVQNQTRLFLVQFTFIIEDENPHYHLVKLSNKYCEFDIIPETINLNDTSTLTLVQRVNLCKLQNVLGQIQNGSWLLF